MNIGLFTSVFFNNIGNAFIDLGAEATLMAAMNENDNLIKLSQCANFAASMSRAFSIKENRIVNWLWVKVMQRFAKKLHDKSYSTISTLDVMSPVKIAKMDYLVIPGCVLTVPFFVIYGKLLEDKVQQGCKLVFLGASGNHYTDNEVREVSKWLDKLHPHCIMTRDSVAYQYYAKYSEFNYNGIDNVWFVNWLKIPKTETTLGDYVVLNFDEPKHNGIKTELIREYGKKYSLIFTDHKPYPYSKVSSSVKKGIVCSDYPLDYLFLYRNVIETHSDRVHACIPTLAFGNKVQLYSDSPRIALFENVGIDINEMKKTPTKIDLDKLCQLQKQQVLFLKNVFATGK